MAFDGKVIIDSLGVIGAAIAWMYQWRNFRFRSKLKSDLEILEKYKLFKVEPEDPSYEILKAHIDEIISKAYSSTKHRNTREIDWSDLILGILFLVGSIIWIVYAWYKFYQGLEMWWWPLLIAGFFVFIGCGGILNHRDKRRVKKRLSKIQNANKD